MQITPPIRLNYTPPFGYGALHNLELSLQLLSGQHLNTQRLSSATQRHYGYMRLLFQNGNNSQCLKLYCR